MEKQYVDEFFEHGKLRIPSFRRFRNNPDEEFGDPFEGRVSAQITTPTGSHAISAINGQEAYVLCATTVESRSLEAKFRTEYGFRITNSLGFANCISSHIAGFVGGFEGLCSYRDDISVKKFIDQSVAPPDTFSNPEEWSKEYEKFVGVQSRDAFLIKRSRYSHQAEYRFIWFSQGIEKDYIDITCPEARQYCQPINSSKSMQLTANAPAD
ncbi:hypothetical protein [Microbulbifer elongatus]|uniref:hypothetical protein n=1 Tax=Microbulbifer elongatus TaxID=86173 RepID=UPI001CFD0604|nr:hypothetical protein [Microbulbifer elongatus]